MTIQMYIVVTICTVWFVLSATDLKQSPLNSYLGRGISFPKEHLSLKYEFVLGFDGQSSEFLHGHRYVLLPVDVMNLEETCWQP